MKHILWRRKPNEAKELTEKVEAEKQAEIERRKREIEQARAIEAEANTLKWHSCSNSDNFGYKNGIVFNKKDDKNNSVAIFYEKGKDTLVKIMSEGKRLPDLPLIQEINEIELIKRKIEQQFSDLLSGQPFLKLW